MIDPKGETVIVGLHLSLDDEPNGSAVSQDIDAGATGINSKYNPARDAVRVGCF
jgi:hypothetical protein